MGLHLDSDAYWLELAKAIREALAASGDGVCLGPTDAELFAELLEAIVNGDHINGPSASEGGSPRQP